MSCRLTILGSGSSGNCAYLETDGTRILVDAGLSAKQIETRLATIGEKISDLHGILVTHEHSDHIQGLRVLASRHRIPIFANRLTREAVLDGLEPAAGTKAVALDWRLFESGQKFPVGDFDIEPFSIPHDAADPVGFSIFRGDRCVVFMTDLGHVTQLVLEKARRANLLILETNHDPRMLQDHPYRPWSLKQRISGRHGHLSNDAAAAALKEIVTDRLKHVFLSHLSQDCNRPELARATIEKKLSEMGAKHIKITVTSQQEPSPTESLLSQQSAVAAELPLFHQQLT